MFIKQLRHHLLPLLVLAGLSLWGMKALFHPGLFTAHDIWHQVARLYHYYEQTKAGMFPPSWVLNLANGFGYPLFFFSYHLPWLIGLPFLILGLTIPVTIKLLLIASFILSGLIFYSLSYRVTKSRFAALVAAAIYLFLPDHLKTVLVSAAMGVAWVYVATPLVFWGLWEMYERPRSRLGILLTALGISGLVLSHLMSLAFLGPLLLAFWLAIWLKASRREFLRQTLIAGLLGLGLSGFYLLPAIYYQPLISAGGSALTRLWETGLLDIKQVIYSPWGYGIAGNNIKTATLSFQLGFAQWGAVMLALALIVFTRFVPNLLAKKPSREFLLTPLLMGFAISLFLALEPSRSVWRIITQYLPLDFPTRFLFPAVFSATLLAGVVLAKLRPPITYLLGMVLLLLAFYTNRNNLRVNEYTDIPVSLYVAAETTTNSFHEYLPKSADVKLLAASSPPLVFTDIAHRSELLSQTANRLVLTLELNQTGTVSFRQFAFPGVQLWLDGQPTTYSADAQGLISGTITSGTHRVEIFYQPTPVIRLSQLLTLVSLAGIILLWRRKPKNSK